MKWETIALLVIGGATLAGCDLYVRPPEAAVEVDAGAPVVYDTYYTHGYYDGGFWFWHDSAGHLMRERREFHEHRMDERSRHIEHHEEEHHEDHR